MSLFNIFGEVGKVANEIFTSSKNKGSAILVRNFINSKMADIGEVQEFNIDAKIKEITL